MHRTGHCDHEELEWVQEVFHGETRSRPLIESSTSTSHQICQIEFRTQRGLEPPVVLGIRDEEIWIRYKCKNSHDH